MLKKKEKDLLVLTVTEETAEEYQERQKRTWWRSLECWLRVQTTIL